MQHFTFQEPTVETLVREWTENSYENPLESEPRVTHHLTIRLAPQYVPNLHRHLKLMDEELVVLVSVITKQLERMSPEERTWDRVTSIFAQTSFAQPLGDVVGNTDTFLYKSDDFWFTQSKSDSLIPASGIVARVDTWFTALLGPNLRRVSPIDIEVLGRVVAKSGVAMKSFFKNSREAHQETVLDVGVVRYPDVRHPYFEVYRVKLVAWYDCRVQKLSGKQFVNNGITGEVFSQKYEPREGSIPAAALEKVRRQRDIDEQTLLEDAKSL